MNGLLVVALLAFAIPAFEARVAPQIIGGKYFHVMVRYYTLATGL